MGTFAAARVWVNSMTRHDTIPPVLFRPAMTEADHSPVCATADAGDTAMARLRHPFLASPKESADGVPAMNR